MTRIIALWWAAMQWCLNKVLPKPVGVDYPLMLVFFLCSSLNEECPVLFKHAVVTSIYKLTVPSEL